MRRVNETVRRFKLTGAEAREAILEYINRKIVEREQGLPIDFPKAEGRCNRTSISLMDSRFRGKVPDRKVYVEVKGSSVLVSLYEIMEDSLTAPKRKKAKKRGWTTSYKLDDEDEDEDESS